MQEDNIKNIYYSVDKIEKYISKLEREITKLRNKEKQTCDFHTYKIVRAIMKLICEGCDENTAIRSVADDYSNVLRFEHIMGIWLDSRRQKNILDLYARIYLAKKMKTSGYSTSDIANTLNTSITTTHKLLKSSAVF